MTNQKTFHFKRFVLGGTIYRVIQFKSRAVVVVRQIVCTSHPFDTSGDSPFEMEYPIEVPPTCFFKTLNK